MCLLTNFMSPVVLKNIVFKENKVKDGKIHQPFLFLTFYRCPRVVFAVQAKHYCKFDCRAPN